MSVLIKSVRRRKSKSKVKFTESICEGLPLIT